jgi:hypothetical protein
MAETQSSIPQPVGERFAKTFDAFVAAVRAAVKEAAQKPEFAGAAAFCAWRDRALPLLEQENASIQSALAQFLVGQSGPIIRLARDAGGLAKNLDGFPLDFAGADHADILDQLETAVVVTAYQVCAAAGLP